MPSYWMVTINGMPLFKGLRSEREARATAERWQGEKHKRGLLKHADLGDHVEVKHDTETERDFEDRYKAMKAGDRQRIIKQERYE